MDFVKLPKHLSRDNVKEVGGKSANLAELINSGFPVPECFFVAVNAYKEFLKENDLEGKILGMLEKIDLNNLQSLQENSQNIKALITNAGMPSKIEQEIATIYRALARTIGTSLVAVRSSAVTEDVEGASSAGQQETFLNIEGEKNVVNSVKKCWASLFTARAIYYRHKHNQPKTPGISVIVQRMIESKKSGIIFTVNPANPDNKNITIEACWGLGETIVQGEVIPDRYVVDKLSGMTLETHIGKKGIQRILESGKTVKEKVPESMVGMQVLSANEIATLAEYAKRIEEHYRTPQDIEYGIDEKIYILQSRAITFLESKKEIETGNSNEILVKGLTASPGIASGFVRIVKNLSEAGKIKKGDILVTEMTSPDFVPVMEKSSAIVTDKGGSTCHAAIVSRELGIPCIVGTTNATRVLKEGSMITVNASKGVVYNGIVEAHEKKVAVKEKTIVKVKLNIAFPSTAKSELAERADGVGLVRIEHMLTEGRIHPMEYIRSGQNQQLINILVEGIGKIAEAFKGKPVWVRTLDARTDEYRNMKGGENEPREDNPMLGWHGIRRSLDEPKIIECEFTAVKKLHERGLKNVGIMLPFVINASEVRRAKEIAKSFGIETVKFGVMIETPAAALIIEDICREGIDFISFGSNDLSQLVLGVDRNNGKLSKLFDEMHPAMMKLFKTVIETCKKYNVETSICGEAGSNPEMVKKLVGFGIDSVSCNIDALDKIRQTVAESERK